jgi:hypothetical protein
VNIHDQFQRKNTVDQSDCATLSICHVYGQFQITRKWKVEMLDLIFGAKQHIPFYQAEQFHVGEQEGQLLLI